MSKHAVIVDGQALMIDDVCHAARQSDAVRLCDVPDFINRINKEAGLVESLRQGSCH